MRLNQLSKHFCHSYWGLSKACILNASTTSSGVKKRWPLIFFTYGNKKKLFGAKSGLFGGWLIKSMVWELKNAVVWANVWELALSAWRVTRVRRLTTGWKTTGKQMVVYYSELTVLCCSSGTIATCSVFPKKQAFICLEVLRVRATFVVAHLETPIQSTAVCFRSHTRKTTIHHLSRCHRPVAKHRNRLFGAFLSTNRHKPCFKRLTNCVGSNANKFLAVICSYNIEFMPVQVMPKVVSISR